MFDTVTDAKPLADLAEMVTVGIANSATHAYVDDGVLMFRNQKRCREQEPKSRQSVYIGTSLVQLIFWQSMKKSITYIVVSYADYFRD